MSISNSRKKTMPPMILLSELHISLLTTNIFLSFLIILQLDFTKEVQINETGKNSNSSNNNIASLLHLSKQSELQKSTNQIFIIATVTS